MAIESNLSTKKCIADALFLSVAELLVHVTMVFLLAIARGQTLR